MGIPDWNGFFPGLPAETGIGGLLVANFIPGSALQFNVSVNEGAIANVVGLAAFPGAPFGVSYLFYKAYSEITLTPGEDPNLPTFSLQFL